MTNDTYQGTYTDNHGAIRSVGAAIDANTYAYSYDGNEATITRRQIAYAKRHNGWVKALTSEQERMAAWMRCKMHGCTASAVFGGMCLTHKDWEQDACEDCGQVYPLDEMHAVWEGVGGYNLCELCLAKYPARAATSDEIKLYFPELWY